MRSANRTCFLFKFIVPCIELKIRIIALVLKSNGKKICVWRNLVEKKTVNSCLLSNPPTQIEAKEDKRLEYGIAVNGVIEKLMFISLG